MLVTAREVIGSLSPRAPVQRHGMATRSWACARSFRHHQCASCSQTRRFAPDRRGSAVQSAARGARSFGDDDGSGILRSRATEASCIGSMRTDRGSNRDPAKDRHGETCARNRSQDKDQDQESSKGINRSEFLVSTSAAALGAATLAQAKRRAGDEKPAGFPLAAGSVIPYSKQELMRGAASKEGPTGEHLTEVAFPLGGIGTGTVSLGGRGQLRDWEIFNRPGKGKILPFSFVALWARPEGEAATVKVVESSLLPPFRGGGGFHRDSAEGLPRFKTARFSRYLSFCSH